MRLFASLCQLELRCSVGVFADRLPQANTPIASPASRGVPFDCVANESALAEKTLSIRRTQVTIIRECSASSRLNSIERGTPAQHFGEEVGGFRGPDEGIGPLVVLGNVALNDSCGAGRLTPPAPFRLLDGGWAAALRSRILQVLSALAGHHPAWKSDLPGPPRAGYNNVCFVSCPFAGFEVIRIGRL